MDRDVEKLPEYWSDFCDDIVECAFGKFMLYKAHCIKIHSANGSVIIQYQEYDEGIGDDGVERKLDVSYSVEAETLLEALEMLWKWYIKTTPLEWVPCGIVKLIDLDEV